MAKTESEQLEQLENAFGDVPESEFDDELNVDTTASEEFQEETSEVEDTNKAKEPHKEKEETDWDKDRQEIDQAQANYRKAASELSATKTELDSQAGLVKTLQDKLDAYVKANEVNIDELDEELVDPAIKGVLKSMQMKLDSANARAESLEQSRDRITKSLEAQAQEADKQRNRAEIVADIEQEFPAKHRNEAIRLANEYCTKRGSAPADRYEAAKILRGFYKQLADAETKNSPKPSKKTETVATDTGGAQSGIVSNEPSKPVTLKQAANEWRQKLRRKT